MNKQFTKKIYKVIMLIVLTASITFILTTVMMYNKTGKNQVKYLKETSGIGRTFQSFYNFINKNYIGEIDEKKMLESAIKGYVDGLGDEYSEYITKDEMKSYLEDTTGKYVGIGVYITNNKETNQIVVLQTIEGSPAEGAGMQSGDIITKINGIEYTGEQLSEASAVLKGQEGTKAKLEILRKNETINLEIERKNIKVNHIKSDVIEGNVGYMKISTFDEGTAKEFKQNWEDLKSKNVSSLIIDLRNNGGGIVDEAIQIADMMTKKDQILLITTGKNQDEKTEKAKNDKEIEIPIVFLINENTASASEILAGAVKENNENVKVVGKSSYGKGVIQTIYTLTDGSGIKLTTNEYYTPKHNKINKIGIKPDVEVELPTDETIYTVKRENDTQLKKAIEVLK